VPVVAIARNGRNLVDVEVRLVGDDVLAEARWDHPWRSRVPRRRVRRGRDGVEAEGSVDGLAGKGNVGEGAGAEDASGNAEGSPPGESLGEAVRHERGHLFEEIGRGR